MSSVTVTADTFGDKLTRQLDQWADGVRRASREDCMEAGQGAAKALRSSSPRLSGRYRSGWRADMEDSGAGFVVRVHNAKSPGLTHLLEHGHGGPHPAPAHPHIEKAANEAFSELDRRMG